MVCNATIGWYPLEHVLAHGCMGECRRIHVKKSARGTNNIVKCSMASHPNHRTRYSPQL